LLPIAVVVSTATIVVILTNKRGKNRWKKTKKKRDKMIATRPSLLVVMFLFFLFSTPWYSSLVHGSTIHEILHKKRGTKTLFSPCMFFQLKKKPRFVNKWCLHPKQISCINNL
jgi:hypothetical protein